MNSSTEPTATAAQSDGLMKGFVISAGWILGLTGVAKVWSAFGDVKLMAVMDPILGVPFKQVMLAAGVAELVIAAVCLFTRFHLVSTKLVAWLATSFLIYRLGLWWIGWQKPCGCLGNLTDALGISPQTADVLIKVLLAYLLIGSYGLLIWHWRNDRKKPDSHQRAVGNQTSEGSNGSDGVQPRE